MNAVTTALITLSDAGAKLLVPLVTALPGARLYVHESVRPGSLREKSAETFEERVPDLLPTAFPESGSQVVQRSQGGNETRIERFTKIADLTAALFPLCRGLVYAAPAGVVVRAVAPLIQSKFHDPAVVVLDVGGRWAVSLLSGHEGGANDLAIQVANLLGAEPVITTTTEALKDVIVGIGCRRGTPAEAIVSAVRSTLDEAGVELNEVRFIASADIKAQEAGMHAAAGILGVPIRFVASDEIRASTREFTRSETVRMKVNLPAVAEPAALLAGRRTRLLCRKKTFPGITIALAREGFPWAGSAPEGR